MWTSLIVLLLQVAQFLPRRKLLGPLRHTFATQFPSEETAAITQTKLTPVGGKNGDSLFVEAGGDSASVRITKCNCC
ncbi:hypothetical protein B0H13DRAFT_2024830 [Mycena leptocephala]|nr:hypothetical protein B0H13DRAFT_2024830 [Mycena leptocephala]